MLSTVDVDHPDVWGQPTDCFAQPIDGTLNWAHTFGPLLGGSCRRTTGFSGRARSSNHYKPPSSPAPLQPLVLPS